MLYMIITKEGVNGFGARAPFLERSGRFSGPVAAQFLTHKPILLR